MKNLLESLGTLRVSHMKGWWAPGNGLLLAALVDVVCLCACVRDPGVVSHGIPSLVGTPGIAEILVLHSGESQERPTEEMCSKCTFIFKRKDAFG